MSVATGLYMLLHISVAMYLYIPVVGIYVTNCKSGYVMNVVLLCANALFHMANGAFLALRAYAISDRSRVLALVIFLLSLVLVAAEIYETCTLLTIIVPDPVGCVLSSDGTSYTQLLVAGQVSTIVAEVLLVAATWRHVYTVKIAKEAHIDTPITTVLLRDGTVYFIMILALLVVSTTLAAIESIVDEFVLPITYVLQALLLSHFYLNLHAASSVDVPSDASQISDLRFTRVVGSLAVSYATHNSPGEGVNVVNDPNSDEESASIREIGGDEQHASTMGSIGELCSVAEVPRIGVTAV